MPFSSNEPHLPGIDLQVGAERCSVRLPTIDTVAVAHADGGSLDLVRDLAAKA